MQTRTRTLTTLITLAAIAATPAAAQAAHTPVRTHVGLPESQLMAALDGTVVLVADHKLMQRGPDGAITPVRGAPTAEYRSIDLGRDGAGELVLTYIRCWHGGCKAISDDLAGHRVTYKKLAPKHCGVTTAPARWGERVAYSLSCTKLSSNTAYDRKRSGLFVRTGAGAPKRLRTPRSDISTVARVDLRGDTVGAVALGKRSYAFSQTVSGTHRRFTRVLDDQGNTDVISMALGRGGVLWTLRAGEDAGGHYWERISRLGASGCDAQPLPIVMPAYDEDNEGGGRTSDPEPVLAAEALAVDGDTVYLSTPAGGLVNHRFTPVSACS